MDLLDVSPVTYPAYSSTTAGLRSQLFEGLEIPEEIRAAADDCGCECPECEGGDCDQCSDEDCDDENCRCRQRSAKAPAAGSEAISHSSDAEFRERMERRLQLAEKI